MTRKNYLSIFTLLALFASCSPSTNDGKSGGSIDEALIMLEAVFEGPHGKLAIGEMMDTVLIRYNVELSRENYLKAGNTLVKKRKESDGSILEMEILAHMINEDSGQRGISFEDQLTKSFRAIKAEMKKTVDLQHR